MNSAVSHKQYEYDFFQNVRPIKLTEARQLKLQAQGWGILTEYYLESVKIYRPRNGQVTSAATLKLGDRSGNAVCVVRGQIVGLLFGVSPLEWKEIESLCNPGGQLFYRYFKNGLSREFPFNQQLFYNYCLVNQKTEALVAVFKRGVNTRNRDRGDTFLEILELRKCDNKLLDLYTDSLRKQC